MTNKETILSAKDKAHSLIISLCTKFIIQGSTSGRVTSTGSIASHIAEPNPPKKFQCYR